MLVPPLDSRRFAEEIVRLASDPGERARIGAIGRARVMERFLVRRNMGLAFARLSDMVQGTVDSRKAVERTCARSGS